MKGFPLILGVAVFAFTSAQAEWPFDSMAYYKFTTNPPFSFVYGGKPSSTILSSWSRTEQITGANGGALLHFTYSDPVTHLKISADVRVFTAYDATDWVLEFTNDGDKDTPILENILPLDQNSGPGKGVVRHARGSDARPNDFEPLVDPIDLGGVCAIASKNGRSSDTNSLPFFNLDLGDRGTLYAIGWTGNWKATFTCNRANGYLVATAGMPKTHFLLHPGETIRTPRIVQLNWHGNSDEAQNLWRRFVLTYYSPKDSQNKTITVPLCLGTWGAEPISAKLDWVKQLHDHQIPFDVYWIDAGWYGDETPKSSEPDMDVAWYRNRGTWVPNATTYPDGFKPLGDALKKADIGFLLWFEAETADPGSALLTQHPDWFLHIPNPPNEGTQLLNLGNPEARKGITKIVSDMITSAGLTWYRQDFNIPADGYWGSGDAPDRIGITEMKYVAGLYQFWDDLRAQHPGLQIDNCSSGGRRLDLETMSRSVSLWRTDYECGFFDPVGGQLETQGLAPWVPLNAGNYGGIAPGTPADGASLIYAFRSNYSAGLVLNPGDRGAQGAIPLDLMKKVGDEFQELHPYFTGDFYALQPYNAGIDSWAAWQFDRPDLKSGMAMLFRRQNSTLASLQPGFKALDPKAQYAVEIRTGFEKSPVKSMSGDELAHLSVSLPDKPCSALIFYHRN